MEWQGSRRRRASAPLLPAAASHRWPAGAAAEHSRRQLQDYSVVADHITALVQKVCALQSGRNCDAVVLDGVAPYWEASFWANSMLPSSKCVPQLLGGALWRVTAGVQQRSRGGFATHLLFLALHGTRV